VNTRTVVMTEEGAEIIRRAYLERAETYYEQRDQAAMQEMIAERACVFIHFRREVLIGPTAEQMQSRRYMAGLFKPRRRVLVDTVCIVRAGDKFYGGVAAMRPEDSCWNRKKQNLVAWRRAIKDYRKYLKALTPMGEVRLLSPAFAFLRDDPADGIQRMARERESHWQINAGRGEYLDVLTPTPKSERAIVRACQGLRSPARPEIYAD
jgi:hypothetical protein